MHDDHIPTTGTLVRPLRPGLYEVTLRNGKTVIAHLSKPLADANADFAPGTTLLLAMTSYDFDQARIEGEMEEVPGDQ